MLHVIQLPRVVLSAGHEIEDSPEVHRLRLAEGAEKILELTLISHLHNLKLLLPFFKFQFCSFAHFAVHKYLCNGRGKCNFSFGNIGLVYTYDLIVLNFWIRIYRKEHLRAETHFVFWLL